MKSIIDSGNGRNGRRHVIGQLGAGAAVPAAAVGANAARAKSRDDEDGVTALQQLGLIRKA